MLVILSGVSGAGKDTIKKEASMVTLAADEIADGTVVIVEDGQ